MLQKLKITTYVFILCLFGLTLITVSPVFAESFEESARVLQCEQSNSADEKANCYKEFARSYYDAQQSSADYVITSYHVVHGSKSINERYAFLRMKYN